MLNYGLAAAVLSMLFITADGLLAKYMLNRLSVKVYAPLVLLLGIAPMLFVQYITGSSYDIGSYTLQILFGGIFLAFGYILDYMSLSKSQVSKVVIFANIQPLLIFIFGLFFLNEGVTTMPLLGAFLIFIGSTMGMYERGFKVDRKLLPAAFANASWGIYWIIIVTAIIQGNYITPLLAARAVAFVVMALFYTAKGNKGTTVPSVRPERKTKNGIIHIPIMAYAIIILAVSFIDSGINISFGIAVYAAFTALGSAITAVAPMLTAAIGRIAFKDRLERHQFAGLLMAVIGAVLIAL